MRNILVAFILFSFPYFSQVSFPYDRFSQWQHSGLLQSFDTNYEVIHLEDYNVDPNGILDCSSILQGLLNQYDHAIFEFPEGTFRLNQPIELHSHQVIVGKGPDLTHFLADLNGLGHVFSINGGLGQLTFEIDSAIQKNQAFIVCPQHNLNIGEWIYLQNDDTSLVYSTWAIGTTGQVLKIQQINGDSIWLDEPIRRDYSGACWLRKITPAREIGFRCFSVERQDDTAPSQTSTFRFYATVDALIESIYSRNCTFAHVDISCSSRITVRKNFFTEGFSYGGGGRGYGVVLQQSTGTCLIEDNIFKHLRHSILLQSGANGNVCALNYSLDPFWQESLLTNNSAGEIVLHGNFPYSNLFEQNCIGNIVIDNSHGSNGPDNLFYRNRANLYGIFFSDQSSPNQLFIGNHVTNLTFPYNLVNWTISGSGHYLFANNNKGTIVPAATQLISDTSFAYIEKPEFVNTDVWLHIGDQPAINYPIPAENRWLNQAIFSTSCGQSDLSIEEDSIVIEYFPNPVENKLKVWCSTSYFGPVKLVDAYGRYFNIEQMVGQDLNIQVENLPCGVYFLEFSFLNRAIKFIKSC